MNRSLALYVRAHTNSQEVKQLREKKKMKRWKRALKRKATKEKNDAKWALYALVFDCETKIDQTQALTFGAYQLCKLIDNSYQCIGRGFFYRDNLPEDNPDEFLLLKNHVANMQSDAPPSKPVPQVISRAEFIKKIFWPAAEARALLVAFNLPYDLTRIASNVVPAKQVNGGWSLILSEKLNEQSGLWEPDAIERRIIITPKDSKGAFIRFAAVLIKSKKSGKRIVKHLHGRFLDLRTLGWALRNESFSLESACKGFKVPGKIAHEPTGRITTEEIDYCWQDVCATVDLLNAMKEEFDLHDIDLKPEKAFSPASIAKAYLKQMNIIQPSAKFAIPDEVLGIAMQAYYGGRSECRIRHTEAPIVYTDFMSQYPTVNASLRLSDLLTAESLQVDIATEEVKQLLAGLRPEMVFDPQFWLQLRFFALVQPDGDILPVRTVYNGESTNIGLNPLTCAEPVWYAGPDLIASFLLTGRVPKVLSAVRVTGSGKQPGLKSVTLRSSVLIDPESEDFFKAVIEARAQIRANSLLSKEERDALTYFLKILANSGAYGLFVEVNPERLPKKDREKIRAFSGETSFETTSTVLEPPGPWYCPIFASLITAGGRLLLARLEASLIERGGSYLFCDTDSMAIVASKEGGLVACEGGPFRLPDGRAAVKALSWEEVKEIIAELDLLKPYDPEKVKESILKVEHDSLDQQLYGFAIAAKRYVVFNKSGDCISIRDPKAHGLGFLMAPEQASDKGTAKGAIWVEQGWQWILDSQSGLDLEPACVV